MNFSVHGGILKREVEYNRGDWRCGIGLSCWLIPLRGIACGSNGRGGLSCGRVREDDQVDGGGGSSSVEIQARKRCRTFR